MSDDRKTVLHVGCGTNTLEKSTTGFAEDGWWEHRFDLNPAVNPDTVGDMRDIPFPDGSFDAVLAKHVLEHLYLHDAMRALREMRRVVKTSGFVVIGCPNLEEIAGDVARIGLHGVAYTSPSGPISPIDMIFGHRASIAAGNEFMAHRCGFSPDTLWQALIDAGFRAIAGLGYKAPSYEIWFIASPDAGRKADVEGKMKRYLAKLS